MNTRRLKIVSLKNKPIIFAKKKHIKKPTEEALIFIFFLEAFAERKKIADEITRTSLIEIEILVYGLKRPLPQTV